MYYGIPTQLWSLSELFGIDYNSMIFILNCQNLKLKIFSYLNGVEDSQDCRFYVAA